MVRKSKVYDEKITIITVNGIIIVIIFNIYVLPFITNQNKYNITNRTVYKNIIILGKCLILNHH